MILNNSNNMIMGNTEVPRIYLGDDIIWEGTSGIMPVSRGLETILFFDDYDDNTKTWYDVNFSRSYYHSKAVLKPSYAGGCVAMAPDEKLLDGIDLSTTDFTVYIVDAFKNDECAWTDFLIGGEEGSWDWRFGMSDWQPIIGRGYDYSGTIYSQGIADTRRGLNVSYVDVIRWNHTSDTMTTYNLGKCGNCTLSRKPTNWNMKIYCGANTTEAYGFTDYWVYSYLKFVAVATSYHGDLEVERNVAWLRELYDTAN